MNYLTKTNFNETFFFVFFTLCLPFVPIITKHILFRPINIIVKVEITSCDLFSSKPCFMHITILKINCEIRPRDRMIVLTFKKKYKLTLRHELGKLHNVPAKMTPSFMKKNYEFNFYVMANDGFDFCGIVCVKVGLNVLQKIYTRYQ